MKNLINRNVEITVKQSEKVVLIAKFLGETECGKGLLFKDEVQNETFALSNNDVVKVTLL